MPEEQNKIEGVPSGLTEESILNTTGISGVPSGLTEEPLHMAGAGGSFEPESTSSKIWKAANTPLIPEGRAEKEAKQITEAPPTLKESEHPLLTGVKRGLSGAYADTAEMARGLTSPLGLATMGLGAAGEAPGALGRIGKAASRIAGAGFGASGAQQAGEGAKDIYEHGATPENVKQTLTGAAFGTLGATGALHGTEMGEAPAQKTLAAPVRAASRMMTPVQKVLPTALGMMAGEAVGHPYYGGIAGRALIPTDILEGPLSKGRVAGLSPEEANVVHLEERLKEAEKDAKPAEEAYRAHDAGRQRGIPAPDDVLKAHEKAQTALQTAREHLQAAREDLATKKTPAASDQPISLTPEQQAEQAERVPKEAPAPTKEENDAKLSSLMDQVKPEPKPEPTPQNVKTPGQVQPETFPQTPRMRPLVPEGPRSLAGEQGTLGKYRQLMEGTPEVSPKSEVSPVGEIMPPEKPAKPGRLGALKAEGGRVVDTEPDIQQKIEEGLQGTAKPVATPAPKTSVKAEIPATETSVKLEVAPKKFEEALPKHEDVESTPEDMTKAEQVLSQHTDQELARFGKKHGVDEANYDFSKRDDHRHRVERDDFVNEVLSRMPKKDIDNIARLSDEFNKKDTTLWSESERNSLSKAQRSRAIMQEHESGLKSVSGGAPDEAGSKEAWENLRKTGRNTEDNKPAENHNEAAVTSGGGKYRGVQEGVPEAGIKGLVLFDHPETGSTLALPEDKVTPGAVKEKLEAHKADWDAKKPKAEPADMAKAADDYNKENGLHPVQPEKIKGTDKRAADIADAFDKMKHDPNDPAVKASYDALKKDINKQWDYATNKLGIKIEPTDADPYGFTSDKPAEKQLFDDVKNNKHLGVFRGGNPLQEGHPLAEVDPKTGETYNTMFRAIHDLFGHVAQGHDFSESGEESAWNAHMQMMDPIARPAMTTETRGQTSWFFNNEGVRSGNKAAGDFADQKAGILPDFAMERDAAKPKDVFDHIKGDKKPFAILTAENPNNERLSDAENTQRNHELLNDLKEMGYNPKSVGGVNKDVEGKTEHAYFVPDITPEDAAELGKKHGQESILTQEGLHHLESGKIDPSDNKGLVIGDKAKEQPYYSVVDGEPFSVPFKESQAPEGVHIPGEAESDIEMTLRGADVPEKTKPYKDMTPAEQEELAATGVSGGAPSAAAGKAKALPTGAELIKKYGESDGDPAHTAFILADGRGVAQEGGNIHDQMLGGKTTDVPAPRERYINEQGAIRMRSYGAYGDRQFNLSIPKNGITTGQLEYLQKMAPQMSSGQVYVEVADPQNQNQVRNLAYGKTNAESLEKAIREIASIKEADKGADLGDLAEKHLTPEEREGITKSEASTKRFLDNMSKIPEVQEFTDAARKGAGERKWYQRSTQAFSAMAKEAPEYFDQEGDQEKFTGLLASGSPQQSVAMNMREALKVWSNYVDKGRPEGAALEKMLRQPSVKGGFTLPDAKVPNAMKALSGEPMWPDITKNSAFKVPSFADNLKGMLNRVTNDGWMALFSDMKASDIQKAHSYHPISVMTRAAAEELGWEPAEAQAAVWAFIKTLTEKGVEASEDPYEMRRYSEDFSDIIKHDPDIKNLLKDMGVDHGKLVERIDKEVEPKPKPKDTSGASPTSEDSARRAFKRVETARGKGTIPASKTGNLFSGIESPEDETTEFNPNKFRTQTDAPKQMTKNASGESDMSQENINRVASQKRRGIKTYAEDSRSGQRRPIMSADAADIKAQDYEHIVQVDGDGNETVMDSGKRARPFGMARRNKGGK